MNRRTIATLAVGLTLMLLAGLLSPASSQTTLPEFSLEEALEIASVEAPPAGVGLKIHAPISRRRLRWPSAISRSTR